MSCSLERRRGSTSPGRTGRTATGPGRLTSFSTALDLCPLPSATMLYQSIWVFWAPIAPGGLATAVHVPVTPKEKKRKKQNESDIF